MIVIHSRTPHIILLLPITFFFLNDTATTEIYTLSLHDALPILLRLMAADAAQLPPLEDGERGVIVSTASVAAYDGRSEEHTSELQSHSDLVCRLLLEKKKKNILTLCIHSIVGKSRSVLSQHHTE